MKLFKTPLLALAMFAALAAWSMAPVAADEEPQLPEDAAQYLILVEGMTWGGTCTTKVREALMALENVGAVVANCTRGTALVTMTSAEAELSQEAAANALSGAGNYRLKSMTKVGEDE